MKTENLQTQVQVWLIDWIANEVKTDKSKIIIDEPFVNFGLGSRQAVILSSDLEEQFGVNLDASVSWEYPTIRDLSAFVASLKTEASEKADTPA